MRIGGGEGNRKERECEWSTREKERKGKGVRGTTWRREDQRRGCDRGRMKEAVNERGFGKGEATEGWSMQGERVEDKWSARGRGIGV